MEGRVIWITGLSGAGKTAVAKALQQSFKKYGVFSISLDGDVLRSILEEEDKKGRSYARKDRIKLSQKYSQLCKNLSSQGFTVIIATVSMFDEIYIWNRRIYQIISKFILTYPLRN